MTSPRGRLRNVSFAVVGQLTQALASFVLQAIAARALGAAGLGSYALLFSVTVMVTAMSNGLVGDSLTVLDRDQAPTRAALENWSLLSSLATGAASAVVFVALDVVSAVDGVIFGVATAVYLIESMLRRLLMAVMRFWALAVVDLSGLSAAVVLIAMWSFFGRLDLTAMITALLVGQTVATAVAVVVLPSPERRLVRPRPARMALVARFGGVRAAQQLIRPTLLTAARSMAAIAAGRAAFGQLEAARIYMAPALLVVQGLGSYLFSSYARRKAAPVAKLLDRADRAAAVMVVVTLAVGVVGTAVSPWASTIVTASSFSVQRVAVFGWAVFAASSAVAMPYSSLAAVRGRQRVVLAVSGLAGLVTAVVIVLVVIVFGARLAIIPFLLAAGSVAQAVIVRSIIIPNRRAALA